MFKIFQTAFTISFVFLAYNIINYMTKIAKEKSEYSKMLANLCDNSVLAYIDTLQGLNSWVETFINLQPQANTYDSKQRQSQGWDIVNESSNVSTQVK
ncbi:MAG: hypothetical protein GX800_12220 [Clostridiaceae bacterium]|nr:hypothetical protein [Clostridiaceae bacterium]